MSLWKKSMIGPVWKIPCRSCGERVGVSWKWSLLSGVPGLVVTAFFLVAIFVTIRFQTRFLVDAINAVVEGPAWMPVLMPIIVGLVAGAPCGIFQAFYTPLVKK